MRIDLHTHSSVSDGTDTPTRLVLNALNSGLDVIALTDHDTFDGIPEAQEAAKRVGVHVLGGIEMSTQHNGHSVHLLGYGADSYHRPLVEELARVRVGRTGRLQAMADQLTAAGLPVSVDEILQQAGAAPSIGRPHVADVLVAKGFAFDRDAAFRDFLNEDGVGYVARYATPLEDAIDMIHDAKGVAVIAHPWARGGEAVLSGEYIESLATEHGLDGIEVEHPMQDAETRRLLFEMGGRLGLVRTGSSDYHGTGKRNHELGQEVTRESAYRDLLRRISERGGVGAN